jgi:hypothetical protein
MEFDLNNIINDILLSYNDTLKSRRLKINRFTNFYKCIDKHNIINKFNYEFTTIKIKKGNNNDGILRITLQKYDLLSIIIKMISCDNNKNDKCNSVNIEKKMLYFTSLLNLLNISPHFVLYYGCDIFDNTHALHMEQCGLLYDNVYYSDLYDFFNGIIDKKIKYINFEYILKIIIFQVMYSIYIFNKFKIIHGDLNFGNILLNKCNGSGYNIYIIGNNKYYIPNTHLNIKISDYGMCWSEYIYLYNSDYINECWKHVGLLNDFNKCKHYDIYLFFKILYSNYSLLINYELLNFMYDIIPHDLLNINKKYLENNRIVDINNNLINDILPINKIIKHKYFGCFKNLNIDNKYIGETYKLKYNVHHKIIKSILL